MSFSMEKKKLLGRIKLSYDKVMEKATQNNK